MERQDERYPDWWFTRYGIAGSSRMYTGGKLVEMGLAADGRHSQIAELEVTDPKGQVRRIDVKTAVVKNGKGEQTIFIPAGDISGTFTITRLIEAQPSTQS